MPTTFATVETLLASELARIEQADLVGRLEERLVPVSREEVG